MKRPALSPETIPLERFAESLRHAALNLGHQALWRYGVVPPEVAEVLAATDSDLRVIQLRQAWTYEDMDRWIDARLDELRP